MYEFFLALLILGIGVNAYLRARRQGVWSWREFAITLAGIALIVTAAVPWELFLMRLGPDHAMTVTVFTVLPIAIGTILLARYLSKRRKL